MTESAARSTPAAPAPSSPRRWGLRAGPWLILLAALLWSSAGAVMKRCSLDGWQISFGRSLVAAVTIALLVPQSRVRPRGAVLWVSLAYAFTVVLFALATKLTTAANAIFLQDTAPLYVLLLSVFVLREPLRKGELASLPLFGVGLLLFFADRLSPGQRAGNVVALVAGVAFAACIVGLRHLSTSNAAALLWGNLLAAAISLPPALRGHAPTLLDTGLVLYLGVFQLGLSYVLFAKGVRTTPALEAALLALLEPVLNPVWTFLWVGECPGRWAMVGGALILIGSVWRATTAEP